MIYYRTIFIRCW